MNCSPSYLALAEFLFLGSHSSQNSVRHLQFTGTVLYRRLGSRSWFLSGGIRICTPCSKMLTLQLHKHPFPNAHWLTINAPTVGYKADNTGVTDEIVHHRVDKKIAEYMASWRDGASENVFLCRREIAHSTDSCKYQKSQRVGLTDWSTILLDRLVKTQEDFFVMGMHQECKKVGSGACFLEKDGNKYRKKMSKNKKN